MFIYAKQSHICVHDMLFRLRSLESLMFSFCYPYLDISLFIYLSVELVLLAWQNLFVLSLGVCK